MPFLADSRGLHRISFERNDGKNSFDDLDGPQVYESPDSGKEEDVI